MNRSSRGEIFAHLLVAVIFLSSAGGCIKVGPNYVRPEIKVEPAWQEADDNRVKSALTHYRSWWRAFNDPILDRLINQAYQENLNLRIAGVRVLEAWAQVGVATGQLYPQTQQIAGSVFRERESAGTPLSGTSLTAPSFGGRNYWQSQLGITASWEIDFWGKFRRALESADAGFQASIADFDNTLVGLTASVANFYISIRTLEKRLAIALQNVEIQRESLKIAQARFEGGTTSQRDVEQAKTVLANTQATIPVLQTQLRQAKDALSVLLGKPPSRTIDQIMAGRTAIIPAPPPQVVVGIPADLLRRRPDIRAAEYNAMAQCAQIGVARAQIFPAFSLTGSFGFFASDVKPNTLGDMFHWANRQGFVGPTVQWNVLNYGRLSNLVRVQDARFQELLLTYQNTVLSAQQDVEDNLAAFLRNQEQAGFLAESADAALKSLDLAVIQYREGITDFTTVLTAQQALLSAQDSLATALGNIAGSLVGVYRALGGGWEIREGRDLVPEEIRQTMRLRTRWGKMLAPASEPPPTPEQQQQKLFIRPPQF
uniref:Efflux transporter outer membrane subunit n=1 Tax=Desulfobacca acetoxidans TaxID=60893 RepID=A0A7C3Z1M0_9BACT